MTVYMTKTWGFGTPSGPLQFSQAGWRDRARTMLRPSDLVVIVGTMTDDTDPDERGKILGLMEPSTEIVSSLDYALSHKPRHFNETGNYRWPFGLELRNAWRFVEPRASLSDISTRRFSMDSVQGIVPLLPDEVESVLALPREEVALLRPIQAAARIEGVDAARRRAAPPPTTNRTGIMHMRRAPAFTYAMELEGASQPAFKIGWAFDYKARERQFNLAALPQLNGLRYRTRLFQLWGTALEAFRMEQTLLRKWDKLRHPSNPEVVVSIVLNALEASWLQYIMEQRRATRGPVTRAQPYPVRGTPQV
jgi:hypothetical protein